MNEGSIQFLRTTQKLFGLDAVPPEPLGQMEPDITVLPKTVEATAFVGGGQTQSPLEFKLILSSRHLH
jgi:hypothetical protein